MDLGWFLSNITDWQNGPLAIWSGGLEYLWRDHWWFLGIVYIYFRRNDLKMAPWLDIVGVVLPLAQAIGRWANYHQSRIIRYTHQHYRGEFLLTVKIEQVNLFKFD